MLAKSNNTPLDSVMLAPIKNRNCIICGVAFEVSRAGKMYCSNKCRQAAYYHRDKIRAIRESQAARHNSCQTIFSIKEYKRYNYYRQKLKNYKELQRQFSHVEEGSPKWKMLYDNPNCALTFERKLIPNKIFDLNIPNLSIEQWSFLRSLYPKMSIVEFIEFVCSLGSNFLSYMNREDGLTNRNADFASNPVRTGYLQHLKKIVSGDIKFVSS